MDGIQLQKTINIYMNRAVTFGVDYELINHGNGIQIDYWNIDKPQPTIEQLEALEPEIIRQENNARIRDEILNIETNKQPRALRELSLNMGGALERLTAINSQIAQLRAQII